MKSVIIAAGAFLAIATPAFAQAPSSNATTLGTETTSGNSAGAPSAATPQGQIATTGGVTAEAPSVPSLEARPSGVVPQALHPTADSSVTGSTAAQPLAK